MTQLSTTQVIDNLAQKKLFDADTAEKAQKLLKDSSEHQTTPVYIQALSAIGAWISSLFFMGVVALSGLVKDDSSMLVVGSILLIAVLAINFSYDRIESIFGSQLLLVMSLTGHVIFSIGLMVTFDSPTVRSIVIMLISIIFMLFYKQKIHKFLSFQIFIGALLVLANDLHMMNIIVPALVTIIGAALVWLWLEESRYLTQKSHEFYRTLQYALVVTLIFGINHFTFFQQYGYTLRELSTSMVHYSIAVGQFLIMAYVIQHILQRMKKSLLQPIGLGLLAITLVLSVLFYQTPAIIASLIVLIVGIERGNRILIPVAVISLIYALVSYYYYLDLTLMHKSQLLMASGAVLTAAGVAINMININKEREA